VTSSTSSEQEKLDAALKEIGRQERVLNQMSTMHSILRDRARAEGTVLLCVVLIVSVVGLAFAFAGGGETVEVFGVGAARSTWLGWLAVVTFSLTLVDLVLDRRGAASRHDDAVRQLAILKSEYRAPPQADEAVAARKRLSERYQAVMDGLPPVPDRLFNRLKAKHLQKVAVSRHLSDHPGLTTRQARRAVRRAVSAS
jgi:hypothetical protein